MCLQLSLLAIIAGQALMLWLVVKLQKQLGECEEECRYLGYLYGNLEREVHEEVRDVG